MKHSVWILWIGAPLAMLVGSPAVSKGAAILLVLSLVIHVIEYLVKRPVFERAGGSMAGHFVQTLIFGLLYWKPLEQQLEARAGSSA